MTSFRPSLPSSRWRPTQMHISAIRQSGWLRAVPVFIVMVIGLGVAAYVTQTIGEDIRVEQVQAQRMSDGRLQVVVRIAGRPDVAMFGLVHTSRLQALRLECPLRTPASHAAPNLQLEASGHVRDGQDDGEETIVSFMLSAEQRSAVFDAACTLIVPIGMRAMRLPVPVVHQPDALAPGSAAPNAETSSRAAHRVSRSGANTANAGHAGAHGQIGAVTALTVSKSQGDLRR